MAGDSLMGDIAQSFEETYAGDPLIASSVNYQVGTGLARPDVYNWPAEVAKEVATAKPDVVIMIFGANDDQDMMVNGKRVVLGTPAWAQEYARRVNQIADEVVTPTRTLIWLEVPPTVRPQINAADVVIDQDLAATAAAHPGMEVVNLAPPLTTASRRLHRVPAGQRRPTGTGPRQRRRPPHGERRQPGGPPHLRGDPPRVGDPAFG